MNSVVKVLVVSVLLSVYFAVGSRTKTEDVLMKILDMYKMLYEDLALVETCELAHNNLRKVHGVENLASSDKLRKDAEARVSRIFNEYDGNLIHPPDPNHHYGENLFQTFGGPRDCKSWVQMWYDEIKDYNWGDPESNMGMTGHFSQVVWASSKEVGCYEETRGSNTIMACEYDPPGNYMGMFGDNVFRPKRVSKGHKKNLY